jgi:hypothetical protein
MLEDKLLLWKFKRGSEQAFRRIYEKYVDGLLTLAANFQLRGSLKGYLSVCVPVESWVAIRGSF